MNISIRVMGLAAMFVAAGALAAHAEDKVIASEQPVIEETFDKDLSNWVSEGPNSAAAFTAKANSASGRCARARDSTITSRCLIGVGHSGYALSKAERRQAGFMK